tara:strand:- start:13763 stop:14026 length:264 start_codon:yes stop_codon:yes gene_type:complete
MAHKNSIESYKQLLADGTITKRQSEVLTILKQDLGQATNRMIAKALSWDINRVTGRMSELREKGLVVENGSFHDKETNRTVILWQCS